MFGGLTSSSGVLTDGVTATTQSAGDNSTKVATTAYTDTAISNLVNSAPSTLDTLGEIATALNNDAALNTTLTNSIATKMPLAGGTFTGNVTISGSNIIFGDSGGTSDDRLTFGAGTDLSIYHDGTDNRIQSATGALRVLSADLSLIHI